MWKWLNIVSLMTACDSVNVSSECINVSKFRVSYNDAGLPPVPKSKCIGGVNNQRVGALCRNGTDAQCKQYLLS